MKFETKTIHAGLAPDPSTGAIMTLIYQTSTYAQEAVGKHKGYEYARTQNPTRTALQDNFAALENGKFGFAFASGMAAMDTIIKLFQSGDEIIAHHDLYGGSYRILTKVFAQYGIKSTFIDLNDAAKLQSAITPQTKLIWAETPTNPTIQIVDLKAIFEVAKTHRILTCVDNTFASPYLQNPLDLGADMVMHSATKYIGGHSDFIMGLVATNNQELAEKLAFIQNSCGAVPGPQDCFLALRGIKTLHVRMDRACSNAMKIAQYLDNHDKVAYVNYPGLTGHPGHALAQEQMSGFGAMLSFSLVDDSMESALNVLNHTHLFRLAESLGGVESLIGHPASMTHASIPKKEREAAGVTDSLIRLSIGIEHVDDLIADLEKALG